MSRSTMLLTVVAVLMLGLIAMPAVGQSTDTARTPWGDPDLQGVWSYATLTPLERAPELEGRAFYTPEEEATYTTLRKSDRPDRPGVDPGGYNALWWDGGWVLPDHRTSQIVDPPTGRLPLNAAGQARVAARSELRQMHPADSWLDRTNWDRCLTYHGVPPVGTNYNNTYHILQTPDMVAIHVENIHDVRIIPIGDRPWLDGAIRGLTGRGTRSWSRPGTIVTRRSCGSCRHRTHGPSSASPVSARTGSTTSSQSRTTRSTRNPGPSNARWPSSTTTSSTSTRATKATMR